MVSLYNLPNKINDLIRDAHPVGGTDVVVIDGGEGRVEDIIEQQLQNMRMVYTEPTAKVLAALASSLEKNGGVYASEVDKVLESFVKSAADPDSFSRTMKYLKQDRSLRDLVKELPGTVKSISKKIDALHALLVDDTDVHAGGEYEDAVKSYQQWLRTKPQLEERINSIKGWHSAKNVLKRIYDAAWLYHGQIETTDIEKPGLNPELEDSPKYMKPLRSLLNDVEFLKNVHSHVASGNKEDIRFSVDKLAERNAAPETALNTPGENKDVSESVPHEHLSETSQVPGEDKVPQKASKVVSKEDVKYIQKVVGVEQDGDFGTKTNAALNKWVRANLENRESGTYIKAKYIFDNGWVHDDATNTFPNLHPIYMGMLRGPLTKEKETKAFDFVDLTFVSPVTKTKVNIPLALMMNRGRKDPLGFIQRMKAHHVLRNDQTLRELVNSDDMISVANAIKEEALRLGLDPKLAPFFLNIFSNINEAAKAKLTKRMTMFEYYAQQFPAEHPKLMSNPSAMRAWLNVMKGQGLSDSSGWLKYSPSEIPSTKSLLTKTVADEILSRMGIGRTVLEDPIKNGWPSEKKKKLKWGDLDLSERRAAMAIAKFWAKKAATEPNDGVIFKRNAVYYILKKVNRNIDPAEAARLYQSHLSEMETTHIPAETKKLPLTEKDLTGPPMNKNVAPIKMDTRPVTPSGTNIVRRDRPGSFKQPLTKKDLTAPSVNKNVAPAPVQMDTRPVTPSGTNIVRRDRPGTFKPLPVGVR